MHTPGTLHLADSRFATEKADVHFTESARAAWGPLGEQKIFQPHIASPDVHVDNARQVRGSANPLMFYTLEWA